MYKKIDETDYFAWVSLITGTGPEHSQDTPEYAETPPDGPNAPGTPLITTELSEKIQNQKTRLKYHQ